MKFEEKLMKLRKEKGLSQEELGNQLNVTRQTVSKWELGLSKPEMEKLIEISRFFNVSLESLTDENQNMDDPIKNTENPIKEPKGNNDIIKKLLICAGIVGLVLLVFGVIFVSGVFKNFNNIFNKAKEQEEEITDFMINAAKDQIDNFGNQTDDAGNFIDSIGSQIQNQIINEYNKQEVDSFNRGFEIYSGTRSKQIVATVLDKVVTNNKKNSDKIITVMYNETTTTAPNEIVELKQSFEQRKDYEIILDYGTNGLVNKVTIKDI